MAIAMCKFTPQRSGPPSATAARSYPGTYSSHIPHPSILPPEENLLEHTIVDLSVHGRVSRVHDGHRRVCISFLLMFDSKL